MLVRAKVSFAGTFSMGKGKVMECSDDAILQDLLKAGYVEEVQQEPTLKGGKKNENKRSNSK